MSKILVIDDNESIRRMIKRIFRNYPYKFDDAENLLDGLKKIQATVYDLIISDLKLPDGTGLEILDKINDLQVQTEVIIMTAYGDIETAVDAMRKGAFDFIIKPINIDEFELKVSNAMEKLELKEKNETLQETINEIVDSEKENFHFDSIIGVSSQIREVIGFIKKVSNSNASILITGESGVGKELVARAIHYNSNRSSMPFVKVNCAVFSEGILESELFGHEKGAFTGAIQKRLGRFEIANGGTIFLDEIGDLSLRIQLKLLQVLQEYTFERVGGNETIAVDVRIIAATNQELEKKIRDGEFREDLFYRINVIPIHIPPLRERKEDIPELINYYMAIFSKKHKKSMKGISNEARSFFKQYSWPGNIRELEHLLERIIILSDGDTITKKNIPKNLFTTKKTAKLNFNQNFSIKESLEEYEKEIIEKAIKYFNGDKDKTADFLNIKTSTLYNKLRKYEIN
ncbi:sigma-54-dependent Fis family transcriptional regulator [bacterium]|nr:sigma-54-dependent Fis family transcriptional regulator [bacterium]